MEGSVQRAGDRLRINAQLIDARTDITNLGRNVRSDRGRFVRDSERAGGIDRLLSSRQNCRRKQKAEIEERPTQDLVAFELYLQAKANRRQLY